MGRDTRICVAKIGAAHGVRGEVRLWPFTEEPMAVTRYGPLSSKDGARTIEIVRSRAVKDHLIATLKDVSDRDAAARLNGIELYVDRTALPPTDDGEYYHADLIGLRAVDAQGAEFGRIVALHNFGAGDIVEILPSSGASLMLPFSDAVVPSVDLEAGHAVVIVPNEIDGEESPP